LQNLLHKFFIEEKEREQASANASAFATYLRPPQKMRLTINRKKRRGREIGASPKPHSNLNN